MRPHRLVLARDPSAAYSNADRLVFAAEIYRPYDDRLVIQTSDPIIHKCKNWL